MTHAEAGSLGGLATYKRYGSKHMKSIGSKGFWTTLFNLAQRQKLTPRTPGVNPYRNLLRNLKAKKG